MAHQPAPPANPRGSRPRPSAYDGTSSGDEYLSEDEELSDHELNMLNSDYGFQRNLNLLPHHHQPHHRHPSDPLRSLHTTDGDFSLPEKNAGDPEIEKGRSMPSYHISHPRSHAYRNPAHGRRPLIDYIKNEWQQAALNPSSSKSTYYDHSDSPSFLQICCAPRLQRSVLILLVLLLLTLGNWKAWAGPQMREQFQLRRSSAERLKYADGWFGANQRPGFADMVHLDTLDEDLVPGSPEASSKDRRLIVIGDVHGCNEELNVLLSEIKYKVRTDHLIFVGDMIAKGPNSAAVIDLAISHNASCVRGNHEDRILLTYRDLADHFSASKKEPPPRPGIPEDAANPPLTDSDEKALGDSSNDHDYEELSRLDILARSHARQLTKQHVEYLSRCPTILDVGSVPGLGKLHVVHAGLIPSVDLERQDPLSVMQMRTIDLETHVPSSQGKGTPWFKLWNKYQSMLPASKRSTIIYGHDSKRGLQIGTYSKGLDTGCVKGGRLTAMVIDGTPKVQPRIVSVPCKDYGHLDKELIKQTVDAANGR